MANTVIVDLVSILKSSEIGKSKSVRQKERDIAQYLRQLLASKKPKNMIVHVPQNEALQTTSHLIQFLGLNQVIIDDLHSSTRLAINTARLLAEQGQVLLCGSGMVMAAAVRDGIAYHQYGSNLDSDIATTETISGQLGIDASQIPDLLSLIGDEIYDIRGVIGARSAIDAIIGYSSVEQIVANTGQLQRTISMIIKQSSQLVLSQKTAISNMLTAQNLNEIRSFERSRINHSALYDLYIENEYFEWLPDDLREQHEPKCNLGSELTSTFIIDTESAAESLFQKLLNAKGCGVALSKEYGMGVSTKSGHSHFIPIKYRDLILRIIESPDIKKTVMDAKAIYKYGIINRISAKGVVCDPGILSFVANTQYKERSLRDLSKEYLDKNVRDYDDLGLCSGNAEMTAGLLGEIADITYRASKAIYKKAMDDKFTINAFNNIDLPFIEALAKMECHGILIDIDAIKEHFSEISHRKLELTKKLRELVGFDVNYSSPVEVGKLLYENLGLPELNKKSSGGHDTSKETLMELSKHHPAPGLIAELRSLGSTADTTLVGLINHCDPDGRVRATYMQNATTTTRLSTRNPSTHGLPSKGGGGKVKRSVVAPQGHKIVSFDLSQVELRILAHMSGDTGLINAFLSGKDIHVQTSAEVFDIIEDEVTDDQRRAAKAINFGIVYGQTHFGLAKKLGISTDDAANFIRKYFQKYPGVAAYVENTKKFAKKHGYVATATNRRIITPGVNDSNSSVRSAAERSAINAPMQGTASDIVKLAMLRINSDFQKRSMKSSIIMQVHDEIVVESPDSEVSMAAGIVKYRMENAIKLLVPLVADGVVGQNLYEYDGKKLSFDGTSHTPTNLI